MMNLFLAALGLTPVVFGSLIGALAPSDEGRAWFERLDQLDYIPPPIVFQIVWPILYVLFGAAIVLYMWGFRTKSVYKAVQAVQTFRGLPLLALLLFVANLFFNFMFTPLQFRFKSLLGTMLVCYATLVTAIALAYVFYVYPLDNAKPKKAKWASLLMLPYIAWLILACTMSTHVYLLNEDER